MKVRSYHRVFLACLGFSLPVSSLSYAEQPAPTYPIKYAFTVTQCDWDEKTSQLTCVLFVRSDGAKSEQIPLQCEQPAGAKPFCTGTFTASAAVENSLFVDQLFVTITEHGISIENYLPDEPFDKGNSAPVLDLGKTSVTHIDPLQKSTLSDLIFLEGRSFGIKQADGGFVYYVPALALFPVDQKFDTEELKRKAEQRALRRIRLGLKNPSVVWKTSKFF